MTTVSRSTRAGMNEQRHTRMHMHDFHRRARQTCTPCVADIRYRSLGVPGVLLGSAADTSHAVCVLARAVYST